MTKRHLSKWMCALVVLGLIGLAPIAAACTDGHTPGFWSNRNGKAVFLGNDGGASSLAMLQSINLKNADGTDFNPTSYEQFREWLLGGNSVNMAYMLSVQLAAMDLNVLHGFVYTSHDIYVSSSIDADGVANLAYVIAEADAALGNDGYTPSGDDDRASQAALKTALDNANNNLNWV